jgi:hypothetical protein
VVQIRTHAQKYFQKIAKAKDGGGAQGGNVKASIASGSGRGRGGGGGPRKPRGAKSKRERLVGFEPGVLATVGASAVAPSLKPYLALPGVGGSVEAGLYHFLSPVVVDGKAPTVVESELAAAAALQRNSRADDAPLGSNSLAIHAPSREFAHIVQRSGSEEGSSGAESPAMRSSTLDQPATNYPSDTTAVPSFAFESVVKAQSSFQEAPNFSSDHHSPPIWANPVPVPHTSNPQQPPLFTGSSSVAVHPVSSSSSSSSAAHPPPPEWYAQGAGMVALLAQAETIDWLADTGGDALPLSGKATQPAKQAKPAPSTKAAANKAAKLAAAAAEIMMARPMEHAMVAVGGGGVGPTTSSSGRKRASSSGSKALSNKRGAKRRKDAPAGTESGAENLRDVSDGTLPFSESSLVRSSSASLR